ncbi:MAG: efflux RND transporter permease subunit [Candidatus Bipolaricaulia bacterium]
MYRRALEWTVEHPKFVVLFIAIITVLAAAGLPRMQTDTDPDHMLSPTAPVRLYDEQVDRWFDLQDQIAIAVVNERHPQGVLNPTTLGKLYRIVQRSLDLEGVVRRNVKSFSTTNNIVSASDSLFQERLLQSDSPSLQDVQELQRALTDNRLFERVLISADRTAAAIYIPVTDTADAKKITDQIRQFIQDEGGDGADGDRFYIGGQRVAEDVFGVLMFQEMAVLSPIVGLVILLALWLMFRGLRFTYILSPMLVAMFSVVWTMGLMIWLKIPVHIMSSMAPVFLMSYGVVDGIHILSEFSNTLRGSRDRKHAIVETMWELRRPMLFTSLTTAAGFASQYLTDIPPVRIFGLFVAFGILVAWFLTVTLIPALVMLTRAEKQTPAMAAAAGNPSQGLFSQWLARLGAFSLKRHKAIFYGGSFVLLLSGLGLTRLHINDSPVWWFKPGAPVRIATDLLNEKFGGVSLLYIVAEGQKDDMKRPEVLRYFENFQKYLEEDPWVGKTLSLADLVKRINRVWNGDDPTWEQIPDSKPAVAQFLLMYLSSGDPSDLQDFVDYTTYDKANIIVHVKSPGSAVMERVVQRATSYLIANPLADVQFNFAGPGYFNDQWNLEMFRGMGLSLLGSALVVLLLLMLDFRSIAWGVIGILPLAFTILVSYGVLAWLGKEFNMPIEVISALSLGMAVDFAIHFIDRFRERYRGTKDLAAAISWTMAVPGVAIFRNAIILLVGFLVLLFAPLTPYVNVGGFIAAIMLLSSLTTLFFLPALIQTFAHQLLKPSQQKEGGRP